MIQEKIISALRWLRREGRELERSEQVVVIIAVVLISLRIILPVWHLADGYLLFSYPFKESGRCLQKDAGCGVDRSRTAIEAGSVGLLALGLILIRRGRR